jgi:outer membrane protein assembly factor BamB
MKKSVYTIVPIVGLLLAGSQMRAVAASTDLGNGFRDHGVAVPISNHRGIVATVDGTGRNVALLWLMDHRGGYSLLMIDAETGKSQQFSTPFPPAGESVDSPYSSLLSSSNRFYTLFRNRLLEFDPSTRAFTFCSKETSGQFAMAMTEDDNGVIWAVSYPQSGVTSYDPESHTFRDYGDVYKQDWLQYQYHMAADDSGWIYFGLGHTASQIIALNPTTGEAKPLLAEDRRKSGMAFVYRDLDGNVYGQALKGEKEAWLQMHKGEAKDIASHDSQQPKKIITGKQDLFHKSFPNGSRIVNCNLVDRLLTTEDAKGGGRKEVHFDYESEGAVIMGEALFPDHSICGGTSFPMRLFLFDAASDTFRNLPSYGQWNNILPYQDKLYAATYPGGHLLEWNSKAPWVDTDPKKPASNPAYLMGSDPSIHRPYQLVVAQGGKMVLMSGTPDYGLTGGGLLLWDIEQRKGTLLPDTELIADQSTLSMVELPGGKLLGGTTTSPGTGGEKKAAEAVLYIMDLATHKIEWREALLPGTQEYSELYAAKDGRVFGIADRKTFFAFDPATRKVSRSKAVESELGTAAYHQGPRSFVPGPTGELYLVFSGGIGLIPTGADDPRLLSRSPVKIETGGAFLEGRIYFSSGSHLYSYALPAPGDK